MARYTGPVTKISRRLKVDLVGGDQAFERRPFPPGQHGRARTKEKEYLTQLQEKPPAPARRATRCCRSSNPASTTSSTAPDSPAPAGRPVSW